MSLTLAKHSDLLLEMGGSVKAQAAGLVLAGRNRSCRPYSPADGFLLLSSLDDWLRQNQGGVIAEAVDDSVDLRGPYASWAEPDGPPLYDARTRLKVLLYGYSVAVTSSRALERSGVNDVACLYLAASQALGLRCLRVVPRYHPKRLERLFTPAAGGGCHGRTGKVGTCSPGRPQAAGLSFTSQGHELRPF